MGHPTTDLWRRLRQHYIPETDMLPGGILVPEVGCNGGRITRRCDAVYVGFTSSSGRQMIGHELKVTRADWRRELDQRDKADPWADACHQWFIVAPSTDIVPREEVPATWGLMVPATRGRRMQILQRPEPRAGHEPPWWAVRSVMARADTLRAQAERDRVNAVLSAAVDGIQSWVENGRVPVRTQYFEYWSRMYHTLHEMADKLPRSGVTSASALRAEELVAAFTAAGVKLAEWTHDRSDPAITPQDLAPVVDLVKQAAAADRLRQWMVQRHQALGMILKHGAELQSLLRELDEDPAQVRARFDQGAKGVTARP